jgi:hypothetical protein
MSDTLINILGLAIGWGLIALGAVLIFRALFADRSRGRRRCPRCWYSMDGVPALTCPECGRTARHLKKLHRTRRRYRRALLNSILPLVGLAVLLTSGVLRLGWARAIPSSVLCAVCPINFEDWDGTFFAAPTPTTPGMPMFGVGVAPVPSAASSEWEDELRGELRRRVQANELWDWQASLLVERVKAAALADGVPLGVHNCREICREDWHADIRRAMTEKEGIPVEDLSIAARCPDPFTRIKRVIFDFQDQASSSFAWTPTTGQTHVTFVGPFALEWTPAPQDRTARLIDAIRVATPDSPGANIEDFWGQPRQQLVRRLQETMINLDEPETLIKDIFLTMEAVSGAAIVVEWHSAWDRGLYQEYALARGPIRGSILDVLDRGLEMPPGNWRLPLRWVVTDGAVHVAFAGSSLPAEILSAPTIIRVYDVRPLLRARLLKSTSPDLLVEESRLIMDVNAEGTKRGWWQLEMAIFNGRLIAETHPNVHATIEELVAKLASEEGVE